jgi:hypothetical protein
MKKLSLYIFLVLMFCNINIARAESTLPKCKDDAETWTNCQGTYKFDNGDQYTGEWKNDKFHGQGTYWYRDGCGGNSSPGEQGCKYIGEWKKGKRHGYDSLTWKDWNRSTEGRMPGYVGEWENNEPNGYGTINYESYAQGQATTYVGEVKDGKKHGQGTLTMVAGGTDENGYTFIGNTVMEDRTEKGIWKNNKLVDKQLPTREEAVQ